MNFKNADTKVFEKACQTLSFQVSYDTKKKQNIRYNKRRI